MHPQTTNIWTQTFDVHRFSFESAGAFGITNEYSGLAALPAHLYWLRRSRICMSLMGNLSYSRSIMDTFSRTDYVAYVGIDWADKKHDVCIQKANSEERE